MIWIGQLSNLQIEIETETTANYQSMEPSYLI